MVEYYCIHCGKTVQRDSDKRWIKSICGDTGKDVRLMAKRWNGKKMSHGSKNLARPFKGEHKVAPKAKKPKKA